MSRNSGGFSPHGAGGIWAGQDFDGDMSIGKRGHAEQWRVEWTKRARLKNGGCCGGEGSNVRPAGGLGMGASVYLVW